MPLITRDRNEPIPGPPPDLDDGQLFEVHYKSCDVRFPDVQDIQNAPSNDRAPGIELFDNRTKSDRQLSNILAGISNRFNHPDGEKSLKRFVVDDPRTGGKFWGGTNGQGPGIFKIVRIVDKTSFDEVHKELIAAHCRKELCIMPPNRQFHKLLVLLAIRPDVNANGTLESRLHQVWNRHSKEVKTYTK